MSAIPDVFVRRYRDLPRERLLYWEDRLSRRWQDAQERLDAINDELVAVIKELERQERGETDAVDAQRSEPG